MTLYELTNEMLDLLALFEEMPPEDEEERAKHQEAIQNTLESLELDMDDKVDSYCQVLAQLKADAEALKKEKLRLAARQSVVESSIERLRNRLKESMEMTGRSKIKTGMFSLSLTQREKAILSPAVTPDVLPDEWRKVKVEADMAEIEKYLKSGGETDLASLQTVTGITIR